VFTPGNDANRPADSPTIQQVVAGGGPIATATTLASSANPVKETLPVTFTATVTGFAPTGSVQFTSDGAVIAGCAAAALTGTGNVKTAQCATSALAVGPHSVVASYAGDAGNQASSRNLAQLVLQTFSCGAFNDMGAGAQFCNEVQWLYNRSVTLGCTLGSYCPADPVSRIGMAAFMNRLGSALAPVDLPPSTGVFAPSLGTPKVVCTTPDFAVVGFPRRAFVQIRASLLEAQSAATFGVQAVISRNGGVSWAGASSFVFPSVTLLAGGPIADRKPASEQAAFDLQVGEKVRFGIRVSRQAGTANPAAIDCANFVSIRNRKASSPPL
jgi:hypothetical protein